MVPSFVVRLVVAQTLMVPWLRVAQRLVQRLVAGHVLFHDAPAVVIAAKSDGRAVVHSAVVKRRAHLIDRYPTPGELDVGEVAGLADSGNAQQFAARDLDRRWGRLSGRQSARNQRPDRIHSERASAIRPSRAEDRLRRDTFCSVPMIHPRRCSTMKSGELKSLLETMPVRSQNICGALNAVGSRDQVGGEAARQKIARRTGQA